MDSPLARVRRSPVCGVITPMRCTGVWLAALAVAMALRAEGGAVNSSS